MFEFDPVLLSRIQFAFVVTFHIVFPSLTIGLSSFLAYVEWKWLKTGQEIYKDMYKFWIKIFALAFGMGVVSGVVMSYQFGTNWSSFSDKVSDVLGPLLGYEVLTAFFLEASFLGIMLFGWGKVSEKMHFVSTLIVAIGTTVSAFWILSANSFMQTPDGYTLLADGRLFPKDWMKIIFNPSFKYHFPHMLLASYLTTSFVLGGVSAYHLIKNKHYEYAKLTLKIAAYLVAILAPIQAVVGDLHGLATLKHQPQKIAALEGLWETEKGAGLRLFAWPDEKNEKNDFEVIIPKLSSIILTHSLNGEIKGLKEWNKTDRPPVKPVFFAFRIMVGVGLIMILVGVFSVFLCLKDKLSESKLMHKVWVLMIPSGYLALVSGWFVTEIGRQPYTVYGVLRTVHSSSPAITGHQVAWSLLLFFLMYSFIFGSGLYYMFKLVNKGYVREETKSEPQNMMETYIIK